MGLIPDFDLVKFLSIGNLFKISPSKLPGSLNKQKMKSIKTFIGIDINQSEEGEIKMVEKSKIFFTFFFAL